MTVWRQFSRFVFLYNYLDYKKNICGGKNGWYHGLLPANSKKKKLIQLIIEKYLNYININTNITHIF